MQRPFILHKTEVQRRTEGKSRFVKGHTHMSLIHTLYSVVLLQCKKFVLSVNNVDVSKLLAVLSCVTLCYIQEKHSVNVNVVYTVKQQVLRGSLSACYEPCCPNECQLHLIVHRVRLCE